MSKSNDNLNKSNLFNKRKCYKCGIEVSEKSIRYCPNCKVLLNPNDLKWRNSFLLFLLFLLLIPIVIMTIVVIFLR